MKMTEISIIMPVYNDEANIGRMIDSILLQSFNNWELIIVDDGSIDNSGKIADKYSENDSRITVYHQNNEGVASARQRGLDISSGRFIIYADSDDWMEKRMLEEMWVKAQSENADVVITDYYCDSINDGSKYCIQKPTSYDPNLIIHEFINNNLLGCLWNKLIRRDIYVKANAFFSPGINYCEDLLMLIRLFVGSNPSIIYLGRAYYHYRINDKSLTNRVTRASLDSMRKFHNETLKLLQNDYRIEELSHSFLINEFSIYFMNKLYNDKTELKERYLLIKNIIGKHTGLRWNLGYRCIEYGWIWLAHKLLRF